MKHICRLMLFVGLAFIPTSAYACLWDYDTLRQERSRFPSTLEVITGKFLRHSPEFYQWRVQDRLKKLEADPNNLAYLDDLAVAYHKLGQHDKAIEIMQRKDRISPNLYETEANISTFYFFAGDLQKSLFHVNRALEINPNAHFGREKYQKYLIEWILVKPSVNWWLVETKISFAHFLDNPEREPNLLKDLSKRQAAIKAVLGMMRFADHKAPILLDALGNLLCSTDARSSEFLKYPDVDDPRVDAKKLASRAFVRASMEVKSQAEKKAFHRKALIVFIEQAGPDDPEHYEDKLDAMQIHFQNELNDADAWYAQLRENEIRWISEGKDVDAEFDKKYYTEPKSETTEPSALINPNNAIQAYGGICAGIVVVLIVSTIFVSRLRTRNRRAKLTLQADYGEPNRSHEKQNPSSEGSVG